MVLAIVKARLIVPISLFSFAKLIGELDLARLKELEDVFTLGECSICREKIILIKSSYQHTKFPNDNFYFGTIDIGFDSIKQWRLVLLKVKLRSGHVVGDVDFWTTFRPKLFPEPRSLVFVVGRGDAGFG